MRMIRPLLVAAMLLGIPLQSHGATSDTDPLKSVMWGYMLKNELLAPADDVVFDDRVQVYAPASVEDGMNVPVSVKINGLDDIEEIVVLADHNPIQRVLNFYPGETEPFIAFRMKVQESSSKVFPFSVLNQLMACRLQVLKHWYQSNKLQRQLLRHLLLLLLKL